MTQLPEGWEWSTIGELCDTVRGVSFKKGESSKSKVSGTIPIIRAGNLSDQGIDFENDLVWVPTERVSMNQRLRRGDIVVATSSGSIKVVGKSAHLMTDWDGAHGAFMSVLRTTTHAVPPYVAWYVRSSAVRAQWSNLAKGTNINNLKKGHLEDTRIPVPPRPEQRRIVAAIEELVSCLDAAEAALRSAQLRLESLVQTCIDSEMASAFEAPLETFASERGITDGPFGSNLKSSHYTDTGPRVVRLENIGRGEFIDEETHITREHYDRLSKHCVEPGDLLVASLYHNRLRACLAPEGLGPAIVKADCIRLRPRGSTEGKFLSYALRRSMINVWCQERVKGVGRQRLGLGAIRELPIPNVDVDRQRAVVNRIGAIEDRTKETREIADQSLRRSAAFRRSILAAAFSGQLIPQNPSDEPASALLERIGAERAASISSSTRKTSL